MRDKGSINLQNPLFETYFLAFTNFNSNGFALYCPADGYGTLMNGKIMNGDHQVTDEDEFDPSDPPPFRIKEIRDAIPKHCWVKSPWRSMSYVIRDVLVVFGLVALALYFNSWVVWPLYWVAQGTMFWALFVLGHDWY